MTKPNYRREYRHYLELMRRVKPLDQDDATAFEAIVDAIAKNENVPKDRAREIAHRELGV